MNRAKSHHIELTSAVVKLPKIVELMLLNWTIVQSGFEGFILIGGPDPSSPGGAIHPLMYVNFLAGVSPRLTDDVDFISGRKGSCRISASGTRISTKWSWHHLVNFWRNDFMCTFSLKMLAILLTSKTAPEVCQACVLWLTHFYGHSDTANVSSRLPSGQQWNESLVPQTQNCKPHAEDFIPANTPQTNASTSVGDVFSRLKASKIRGLEMFGVLHHIYVCTKF